MAQIPPQLIQESVPGLTLLRRGKVRDTYELPGHPDKLLVVASDRISIFDHVLNAFVPEKGATLTAQNVFWRIKIMKELFPHDLFAFGSAIDAFLPEQARGNVDLQTRAVVVRKLDMLNFEAIVRGALTGTGLKAYNANGVVCGHRLPQGLMDGDVLSFPLFTPTTKAEVGHDEHVTADSVGDEYGLGPERLALQLFTLARDYARSRGVVLADTKFEFGLRNGVLTVGDEVLTPDSSRYWDLREWEASRKKDTRSSPTSFDKQFVREWGKLVGIDKRDPKNSEDVSWVHDQVVPETILARTTQLYRYIFWRITGMKLERFQHQEMGIGAWPAPLRIEIVTGSATDLPQMKEGLAFLETYAAGSDLVARRHVISCHRNPDELALFVRKLPEDRIVIAGAGLAAALPGVLKALLVQEGKSQVPVIGVAFAGGGEEGDRAAALSIKMLPNQPVVMDPSGEPYFGPQGFTNACKAAVEHEFLPTVPAGAKPAELNADVIGVR